MTDVRDVEVGRPLASRPWRHQRMRGGARQRRRQRQTGAQLLDKVTIRHDCALCWSSAPVARQYNIICGQEVRGAGYDADVNAATIAAAMAAWPVSLG
jgi:hypothetical protein